MSVTVAAALKKVAAAVLTDKKAGKTVAGIVLAVILIVIFPIVGVTGALGSLGKADAAQLQAILAENLSKQEITKLQTFEDTMRAIESAMAEAGFASRTREAAGRTTGRTPPTGTTKGMWRFGGRHGRPAPTGHWRPPVIPPW